MCVFPNSLIPELPDKKYQAFGYALTQNFPQTFWFLSGAVGEEVCDGETFNTNCPLGAVLDIKRAFYGRLKLGECISIDLGYLGCGKDALPEMDAWCSGRESCSVIVDKKENLMLNEGNTCVKDIVSYLDIDFDCVAGMVLILHLLFYIPGTFYGCVVLVHRPLTCKNYRRNHAEQAQSLHECLTRLPLIFKAHVKCSVLVRQYHKGV